MGADQRVKAAVVEEFGEGSVGPVGEVHDVLVFAAALVNGAVRFQVRGVYELCKLLNLIGVLWFVILPVIFENLLGFCSVLLRGQLKKR